MEEDLRNLNNLGCMSYILLAPLKTQFNISDATTWLGHHYLGSLVYQKRSKSAN
jgi:hypothetical protein